ncbi:MAG: two-component regulator propeller domain-containing protein [Chitinophagales bacterium]
MINGYLPLLLIFVCRINMSASQDLCFHHLSTADGLANNQVWAMAQDSSGFIWFATNNGLQRYDGKNFITYRHDPADPSSIASNLVGGVLIDSNDNVWVTTSPVSILRLDRYRKKFTTIESGADSIISILLSPKGEVWATGSRGLYRYDYRLQKFICEGVLPSSEKFDIAISIFDRQLPIVWLGMSTGMYAYDLTTKVLFPCNKKNDRYYIPIGGHVDCIYSTRSGSLWISTYSMGLFCFDPQTRNFKSFDQKKIMEQIGLKNGVNIFFHDFHEDMLGNFRIATEHGGLLTYDGKKSKFTSNRYSPSNPMSLQYNTSINTIREDHEGNIWLTSDQGVSCFNPAQTMFTNHTHDALNPHSFPKTAPLKFLKSTQGEYWIATSDGGVVKCDSLFNILKVYKSGRNLIDQQSPYAEYDQFLSLLEDSHGRIWIGGRASHLSIYDPATERFSNSQPEIFKHFSPIVMKKDDQGNILIGMRRGSFCIWSERLQNFFSYDSLFQSAGIVPHLSDDMLIENANSIWITSESKGLVHFIPEKKSIKYFIPYDQMQGDVNADSAVLCVSRFDNNNLSVGTANNGVYLFNLQSEKFSRLVPVNGLFDAFIVGVSEPLRNKLWFESYSGLCQFDLYSREIIHYTEADGIADNSYNSPFYQDGNRLLIGNSFGFLCIDPTRVLQTPPRRFVKITRFRVQNQQINIDSLMEHRLPVEIANSKNYFSIDFACPSYFQAHSFSYSYRLRGADQDWRFPSPNNEVTYSGLKSGHYVFEVRAISSSIEDAPVTQIAIEILLPFYLNWWFLLIYFIIIGAIVFSYAMIRKRNRTSMQNIRKRISADLHDDIGSTLNSISVYSEIAYQQMNINTGNAKNILEKMGDASREMIDIMNDIVWTVNPKNDNFENILKRMRYFAGELLSGQNILLQFDTDERVKKIKLTMEQRKNFYLIYKEAINNIYKYSICKNVNVSVALENSHLIMIITDNGKGFETSMEPETIIIKQSGGNGLKNMKVRAEEIKAKLTITSWVGKGTRIHFSMALK